MLIKSKKIRIECLRNCESGSVEEAPSFNLKVVQAVRGALSRLSDVEREVVERFYFCGESCAQIEEELKIPEFRLNAILKEARRRLKEHLARFVKKRYGIPATHASCQICLSENRPAIEKLLKTKTKEETWKRILRSLKTEFQISTNARSLARHLKRHQKPAEKKSAGNTI